MFEFACLPEHPVFCISAEYAPASEQAGMVHRIGPDGQRIMASPEAVERLGVRVRWVANDYLTNIAARRLRETCVDGACVVFRMSCSGLTCSWQATPRGDEPIAFLSEARLVADSEAAIAEARCNVFVSVNTPRGVRHVSLEDMQTSTPAPTGRYTGPVSGADD